MKKAAIIVSGAFLVILLATFAGAQQGMGGMGMMDDDDMPMMGSGMGMGYGMDSGTGSCSMMGSMGMMGTRVFGMLGLSAEQRAKMTKIKDGLRKEQWALMGKVMDEQAKLRDLSEEEKPDAKKIAVVIDAIHGLQKQMVELKIDAYNRMRDMLTKEQQEQLSRLRQGGMRGVGSRRGMMMGQ